MYERDVQTEVIWPEGPPRDSWHSFDSTPWLHPWLTNCNLRAMREASARWREEAHQVVEQSGRGPGRFAFVGNIANGMYLRAKPVSRNGAGIEVFAAYGDDSILSDPRWEEYDGILPEGISYLKSDRSFLNGIATAVPFSQFDVTGDWALMNADSCPPFARKLDFLRWSQYFAHTPAMQRLQTFDAVLATQVPYIAYLSGKPYAATPMGGDMWLEASRDDALGRLQRKSFELAGCVLSSNPWCYSFARRYGIKNLIQLPLIPRRS